jgi:hypothetical protein
MPVIVGQSYSATQASAPAQLGRDRRIVRAATVAALWAGAALPMAFGWQRCLLASWFHVPCPGCGMTRALALLAAGRFGESVRMNALALPALVIGSAFALATVVTTARVGTPFEVHRTRSGRAALVGALLVYAAALVLWGLRWFGWFGGPVPVG